RLAPRAFHTRPGRSRPDSHTPTTTNLPMQTPLSSTALPLCKRPCLPPRHRPLVPPCSRVRKCPLLAAHEKMLFAPPAAPCPDPRSRAERPHGLTPAVPFLPTKARLQVDENGGLC